MFDKRYEGKTALSGDVSHEESKAKTLADRKLSL